MTPHDRHLHRLAMDCSAVERLIRDLEHVRSRIDPSNMLRSITTREGANAIVACHADLRVAEAIAAMREVLGMLAVEHESLERTL